MEKRYILDILIPDKDPWTLEYEHKFDPSHKFLQICDEKIISWFNDGYGGNGSVKQGRWRHCVVDFFKKEGFEIDFSKRGFYD